MSISRYGALGLSVKTSFEDTALQILNKHTRVYGESLELFKYSFRRFSFLRRRLIFIVGFINYFHSVHIFIENCQFIVSSIAVDSLSPQSVHSNNI